jgi:hypothetical protein
MKPSTGWMRLLLVLAVAAVLLASAVMMSAQVQTTTDTTNDGKATKATKALKGEIVYINGRDVIIKMDDGTLRHFNNVPDSTTVMVDGKPVGIKDAKVGMKIEKTVTTTTQPKVITTTKTVTGTVWYVRPPDRVILTLEDGKNHEFKIPQGQKFTVNGQQTDAWGLKKGMVVNATQVVEQPIEVVTQQAKLTGQMPPPPPPPPAEQPILVAVLVPVPAPAPAAPAEAAPAALPKTGGELPLLFMLGFASLTGSAGMRLLRKRG